MSILKGKRDWFATFAWGVLAYNVLVILWGAVVRATGSGAGCGAHWPLCNGAAVPAAPQLETIIEYIHRAMSGASLLSVGLLAVWAFRRFGAGHRVRRGAVGSLAFVLSEAALGAGLVLFGYVARDTSVQRVVSISLHLVNTFLLLLMLTLTAWWASGGAPIRVRGRGAIAWLVAFAFLGVILIGVSGAITALGDTLFPAASLTEGLAQDTSPAASFLIKLRVIHPLIAVLVGAYLLALTAIWNPRAGPGHVRLKHLLRVLVLIQLAAGAANVVLLAPVWMQIIHLFLADAIWITLASFGASGLAMAPDESLVRDRGPGGLVNAPAD